MKRSSMKNKSKNLPKVGFSAFQIKLSLRYNVAIALLELTSATRLGQSKVSPGGSCCSMQSQCVFLLSRACRGKKSAVKTL